MSGRFHYVFEAADYDAAVAFYRDTLALPIVESWDRGDDRGTMFQAASGIVEVVSDAAGLRGPHRRGICIEVQGIDAVEQELRAKGATLELPAGPRPWGTRELVVLDADGQAVTFFERESGAAEPT